MIASAATMDTLVPAELVLYSILGLILVENIFEIYISLRQVKVYKTALTIPKELEDCMTDDAFHKARLYGLDRENFGIFKSVLMDVSINIVEIYCGILATYWTWAENIVARFNWDTKSEIIVSLTFITLISVISFFKDLPFKVYKTFVLEQKHGFNNQTARFFIIDQIKGFVVSEVIMIPIVSAIIFIVQRGGDHFFIWLWLFTGMISLILLTIYPIFIAPLFDKYTPLEDGPLRKSIEDLANRVRFPLTKLYVVEGSKRSSHSNAYFYGLWNSKRIVLFDTLLLNKGKADDSSLSDDEKGKGCTDEEVLAVLGHELGHWYLGHVTKNIVIMQIHLLLMFVVFGNCFKYAPFYEALGFAPGTRPILVGLLIVLTYVMAPYNAIVNFAMTVLSRRFEYQADKFAACLGYAKNLSRSLIKLNLDNLGFPVHDWLYSSWSHSHPTLLQRLNRLRQLEQEDGLTLKKEN